MKLRIGGWDICTMSLSAFPEYTRICFSYKDVVAEAVVLYSKKGAFLGHNMNIFWSLEDFVEYICNKDCNLSIWCAEQYIDYAWDVCTFYKSGTWYSCKEMITPPPSTSDVLDAVRFLQTVSSQEEFDIFTPEQPLSRYTITQYYSDTCYNTLQIHPCGDHYDVVFLPIASEVLQFHPCGDCYEDMDMVVPFASEIPISTTELKKATLLQYIWTFLDIACLDKPHRLDICIPGFPPISVPSSCLNDKKNTLYCAFAMSLEAFHVSIP